MNKAWLAIAWLLSIAALPACATSGNEPTGAGGGASTGSSSSSSGSGGQDSTDGGTDASDASDPSTTPCGDGQLASSESCDDGNTKDGDGCSATCEFEKGWTCVGAPAKCSAICGDGLLLGEETCDDGNTKKGDGCNAKCSSEDGWACNSASPSVCTTVCGDGYITGKEQCDDGNTVAEDGCDAVCIVELGYACISAPSHCSTQCGDGVITKGEDCDDDNVVSGDGCTDKCVREEKWTCAGQPSVCLTPCGDGLVLGKEQCDDQGNVAGDGCSPTCNLELGWSCDGEPSACLTTCGDGIIAGIEKCDDGNAKGNDGCSIACKVEPGWSCNEKSPSSCVTGCGDGFPTGVEACDDGNSVSGDGCSSICQVEPGFICISIPSTCIALCGDGIVTGVEQCDDANSVNNDGCDVNCNIQPGWQCSAQPGSPTVCNSVCGDGIVVGVESCDDGNAFNGDCCSATCQSEPACEVEPNNEAGLANDFGTLSDDGVIKGRIQPASDTDFFAISVAPNTTIAITAETVDGSSSTCLLNTLDSTINIYGEDGVTQLGTDDNNGAGNCSLVTVGALNGGPSGADYFVEVRSSVAGKAFDYTLKLSIDITTCGNGIKETGEQCDDKNTVSGDGCDSACIYEVFAEIEPNNTAAAANGNGAYPLNGLWTGEISASTDIDFYLITLSARTDLSIEIFDSTGPSSCVTIDPRIELRAANGTTVLANDSSDGVNSCGLINSTNDFGARSLAPGAYYVTVLPEFTSSTVPIAYTMTVTPTALCGNGLVEGFEQCDSTSNCDANCDLLPVCGDGVRTATEQCDDGNVTSGDGCDSSCQFELIAETEPNNTFAQADALPVISGNALISAAIGVVGDKDIFKLSVATLSVIRIETFENLALDCPTLLTTVRVFDSAGVSVKLDSSASGIGSCAALVVRLAPGSYYVQAERTSNTAVIPSYFLQIKFATNLGTETEPNDTQVLANAVSGSDFHVFGDHQLAPDSDYYALTIPPGKSIRIETVEGDVVETCEGNGVDSTVTLFNAAATSLVVDGDGGRGFCSLIDGTGNAPRNAPAHNLAAGTYYIQVKGFSTSGANSQFNYNLHVTVR